MEVLGIDIGGSGAKGAVVDTATGSLLSDRYKIRTPEPLPPLELAEAASAIVAHHRWDGPVGCGLPAVIRGGVAYSAANIHPTWVGTDAAALFSAAVGRPVTVLNDADAAGIAEARLGAARDATGVVILLTLGTGIGSAILVDGVLHPNTELGHLEFRGADAEKFAAASVRKRLDLSYEEWTQRVNAYLAYVEATLSPDLIVLGGGISRLAGEFLHLVKAGVPVVAAHFTNNAGIVGTALAAAAAQEA